MLLALVQKRKHLLLFVTDTETEKSAEFRARQNSFIIIHKKENANFFLNQFAIVAK